MKSPTPQTGSITPNPAAQESLRALIKAAVREMVFSAAANARSLPPVSKARLAMLDLLVNPPSQPPEGDCAAVIQNRGMVSLVDGILAEIAAQAPAKRKKRPRRNRR
jgi:hypothetical protein